IAVLLVVAALAPLIAPYAPDAVDLGARRAAPSMAHWFGTDDLGRDVLTRAMHGARISILIGLLAAGTSVLLGAAIGLVAGAMGGTTDAIAMRLTDAMLALPRLPLLMTLAAILRPSVPVLVLLVGLVGWMET